MGGERSAMGFEALSWGPKITGHTWGHFVPHQVAFEHEAESTCPIGDHFCKGFGFGTSSNQSGLDLAYHMTVPAFREGTAPSCRRLHFFFARQRSRLSVWNFVVHFLIPLLA